MGAVQAGCLLIITLGTLIYTLKKDKIKTLQDVYKRQAIQNGALGATHTGNAMKLLHQHFPAIWGAVLEDDEVYCEMICDGRHLHPGTVRFIIKIKGLDRVIAVTDSIMAAGLPDGNYKLGVNDVVVVDEMCIRDRAGTGWPAALG